MAAGKAGSVLASLPDPGGARTLDEFVEKLRLLRVWAGSPSYEAIKERVNVSWAKAGRTASEMTKKATVADCFKTGRRRLNTDLVLAVVQALHPEVGYVAQWRQALRVIGGEIDAAAQVRVQDRLPQGLAAFTGRSSELDQLRDAQDRAQRDGGAVVISAIQGMAGVGKTQLAVHAGHLLTREKSFSRVLFVNLRGFHPDPAQPPADPAAVLDGFLRLLGVPGQAIPHDLPARTAAYRDRLAGTQTLVVLDNAADAEQVRPLLPATPGCLTLVTSRRSLSDLHPAIHLTVDVFAPEEAVAFLGRAVPDVPAGMDPMAAERIAQRCGHLPLALGLVAGHIRGTPGWTLTDHADRLDERHHRQLDSGVELALDLSYQHLPADQQLLLRLVALHPGQDFDAYAAAALSDIDFATAEDHLQHLCDDHLLQQATAGRYSFHDLVRAYAEVRAIDEDSPTQRHAALTRLFDFYLATAAAAMDGLLPAETHRRPRIRLPATPIPVLADLDSARAWLNTERPTLVAVAAHTAAHGWPSHTTRLSTLLHRYLAGGHFADALSVHGHARNAAQRDNDPIAEGEALTNLGSVHTQLGHHELATDHLQLALRRYPQSGAYVGRARALANLAVTQQRLGRYQLAADHLEAALTLFQLAGDGYGEASALGNLAFIEQRLGRYRPAADRHRKALSLHRRAGDRYGEANTLNNLGEVEMRLGWHGSAGDHLQQALTLFRQLGNRSGEAAALESLGTLHYQLGEPARATEHHQQSLAISREIGHRYGQAAALNGLGEAAQAAGRAAEALAYHEAAHAIAAEIGTPDQQARAHTGLGHAHHALGDATATRDHWQLALTLYTEQGMPQADEIRAYLTALDTTGRELS